VVVVHEVAGEGDEVRALGGDEGDGLLHRPLGEQAPGVEV
jgi:hypothetical protein